MSAKQRSSQTAAQTSVPCDEPRYYGDALIMTPGYDPDQDPLLKKIYPISQGTRANALSWPTTQLPLGVTVAAMCMHKEGGKDGPGFVGGEIIGNRRLAAAVKQLTFVGLDLDTGKKPEEIDTVLARFGRMALRYTTHSNGKTETEFPKAKVVKFAQANNLDPEDISVELMQDFMREGMFESYLVDSISDVEEDQTESGFVVRVHHCPVPKNRIVFPLAEPFVMAKEASQQKDAIDKWKKIPAGIGKLLGFDYDTTGTDPSRLFYYPRHKKGRKFEIRLFGGPAFDWRSLELDNPLLQAAEAMTNGGKRKGKSKTPEGQNLGRWAKKKAEGFQIVDLLREEAEDRIRAEVQAGVEIECPFDEDHSNAGDPDDRACLAVNGGDGTSPIFTISCRHESCQGKTALDMLGKMIKDQWFDAVSVWDERFDALEDTAQPASTSPSEQQLKPFRVHEDEQELIEHMKEHAAVVRLPNQVLVVAEKGGGRFDLLRPSDAGTWFAPMQLISGTEQKPKFTPGLKVYLGAPERLEFDGLTSDPRVPFRTPPLYTTWRGFSRKARRGSWALMKKHLRDVICAGSDEHLLWLLCWIAQMLQQPWKKLGTAVVLRGGKGTGKSTVADWLREIIGELHSRKVSQGSHVTGRFNDHLRDCLFLSVEEGVWGGDKVAEGVLKDLITASTIMVEPKGLGVFAFDSFTRIFITSNNSWIIPATGDERRFFVLEVADIFERASTDRRAYFEALNAEAENGGLEAMLADLLEFDFEQVDLRRPPVTDGLRAQVAQNFTAEQEWLLSALETGEFTRSDGCRSGDAWELDKPLTISNENLLASFNGAVKGRNGAPASARRMLAVLEAHGEVVRKRLTDLHGDRPHGVILTGRAEWRARFEKAHKYNFDPNGDGGGEVQTASIFDFPVHRERTGACG